MFALFFEIYLAMFTGNWETYNLNNIASVMKEPINGIGVFLSSLFNDVNTPYATLGQNLFGINPLSWLYLVSFILALITSIGIVVMAVKGIKRVFGVFFMGIR